MVQDSTGGVLPNANVSVTNVGTSITNRTTANEVGTFIFPVLQPGRYTLRVEATGFRTLEQSEIQLDSARDLRSNYALQVGDVSETITVEAQAAQVSTASAEQRGGLETTQIHNLPNANRNITNLIQLQPGVQSGGTGGNRGIRLNGMGSHSTTYAVDGVESSGQTDGKQMSAYGAQNRVDMLGAEAVQEVQVIKGIVPAEYSNTISGQVNMITKSGTSQLHGSLFHLYQGSAFAARDRFLGPTAAKPKVVYNQFGGSLGGPFFQNIGGPITSAFGFFTYEGYRETRGRRVQGTSPTQLARDVLLSSPHFDDRERQLVAIKLAEMPLPNDPGSLDNFTCAACGGQTGLTALHITARPEVFNDNIYMFKGDFHLADGSVLAMTYNRMNPYQLQTNWAPINQRTTLNSNYRYGVNWFKSMGNWNAEVRGGHTWVVQDRINPAIFTRDPTRPGPEAILFDNSIPQYSISGLFSTIGGESRFTWAPYDNVEAKIGYLTGNHLFKWGASYRRQAGSAINPESPTIDYDSGNAEASFEQFYNNLSPTEATMQTIQPFHDLAAHMLGGFVQDTWRVHPTLTLNLGLRYDYIAAVRLGRSTWDKYPTAPTQQLALLNLLPPQTDADWQNFNFGSQLFAQPLNDDTMNLAPRIGFTYDVGGAGRSVIRGGFAMMYAPATINAQRDLVVDYPLARETQFTGELPERFGFSAGTLNGDARPAILTLVGEAGGQPSPALLQNPDTRAPYTMTWTLGGQRQLASDTVLDIDYTITRGVQLPQQRFVNQPDRLTGQRPNPTLTASWYYDSSQQSFYNGVMVGLRKRFNRSLMFNANYTWGKVLATAGGDIGAFRAASDNTLGIQDFFNPGLAYGRTNQDISHNFNANWHYELPSPPGALGAIIGGWAFSGIWRMNTGIPIGVTQSSNGGRGFQQADILVSDLNDAKLPGNYRETLRWWDRDAFAIVPTGTTDGDPNTPNHNVPIRNGNAHPRIMNGPGFWNVNLSVGKDFQVTEGIEFQFRWDALNALNRVNYSDPVGNINSGQFGQIQGAGPMRTQQINAKFVF